MVWYGVTILPPEAACCVVAAQRLDKMILYWMSMVWGFQCNSLTGGLSREIQPREIIRPSHQTTLSTTNYCTY